MTRAEKAKNMLKKICTPRIGFVQVGASSFYVFMTEDLEKEGEAAINQKAKDLMFKVTHSEPDFETMTVDGGKQGGIVMMQRYMWEIVFPNEMSLRDKGDMALSCALEAQARMLESCKKAEIMGMFVI